MKKQILVFVFSILVGIIIFWGVAKFVGFKAIKSSFATFTWWEWLVVFLFNLAYIFLEVLGWKIILAAQKHKIAFRDLLSPYFIAYGVSFFAPIVFFAGEVLQGYFLKKKVNISWADDIISIFIDRFLQLTINLIIFSIGFVFLILHGGGSLSPHLALFLKIVFLLSLSLFSYLYIRIFKKGSILMITFKILGLRHVLFTHFGEKSLEIENQIFQFFRERKKLYQAIVVDALRGITMVIGVSVLIFFLDKRVIIWPSFSILGSTYLVSLIPIPATLGTHELIQLFTFHIFGLSEWSSVVFVNILRIVQGTIALFGMAILLKFVLLSFKNIFVSKINLLKKRKIKV